MLKDPIHSDYLRLGIQTQLGPLTSLAPFRAEQAYLLEVGPESEAAGEQLCSE